LQTAHRHVSQSAEFALRKLLYSVYLHTYGSGVWSAMIGAVHREEQRRFAHVASCSGDREQKPARQEDIRRRRVRPADRQADVHQHRQQVPQPAQRLDGEAQQNGASVCVCVCVCVCVVNFISTGDIYGDFHLQTGNIPRPINRQRRRFAKCFILWLLSGAYVATRRGISVYIPPKISQPYKFLCGYWLFFSLRPRTNSISCQCAP